MTDTVTLVALWLQSLVCVISILCLVVYFPARVFRTSCRFLLSFYRAERRHSLLLCWNLAVLVLCLQHGLLCVALLVGSFLNELHEAPCVLQGVLIYFSESGVFVYTMFMALVWCMQVRSLSGVAVAVYFVLFACVTVVPIAFFLAGLIMMHSYVVDHIWCRFYGQSWQYYVFQGMFRSLQAVAAIFTAGAVVAGFVGYRRSQPQLRLKRAAVKPSRSAGSTFASLVGEQVSQLTTGDRSAEDTGEASPYARLEEDEEAADLQRLRQVQATEEHHRAEAELAQREEEEWSPENEDRAEELRQLHDEAFMREMELRYREHEGDSDEDVANAGDGEERDADDVSSVHSAMYAVQPREVLHEVLEEMRSASPADAPLRGLWSDRRLFDPGKRRGVLDVCVFVGLVVLYIGCWIGTFFQAILYDFHTRSSDLGFVVILVAIGRPFSALFGIRLAILLSDVIARCQKARASLPPPDTSFRKKGPAEIESRVSVLDDGGLLEMELSTVEVDDAQSPHVGHTPEPAAHDDAWSPRAGHAPEPSAQDDAHSPHVGLAPEPTCGEVDEVPVSCS